MDCQTKNLTFPLLLIFLCSWGQWCHGEDFRTRWNSLASSEKTASDVAAEVEFGRRVAAYILGREDLLENPQLTRYVNLVGKSLALHSARSDLEFHFGILQDKAINAYSTPGGYVFVTRGALRLVKDESELAAILAHEIAHVNARHIVKEMHIHGTDHRDLAVFTKLLGASNETTRATLSQAVDSTLNLLFKKGYKISDELEADRIALMILADTGYNPLALAHYLRRADQHTANHPAEKTPTHPSSKERFAQLQSVIKEENLSSTKPAQSNLAVMQNRFSKFFPLE
jgi:predicted Zn-dependent protease